MVQGDGGDERTERSSRYIIKSRGSRTEPREEVCKEESSVSLLTRKE